MRIPFVKMSGAGNDMILIDHRRRFLGDGIADFVRAACDRHHGIGADGVILVEADPDADVDFAVRFFNPDGGEYGLCGNGARCVPVFAAEIGFPGPRYRFRGPAGLHEAQVIDAGRVRIRLAPVGGIRLDIEADVDGRPVRLDQGAIADPHAVLWVDDVGRTPVSAWGAHLRRHPAFGPAGTNVSFARVCGPDHLEIRTFERGVEGETAACGSGSTVVAFLARKRGLVGDVVRLTVRSGDVLIVRLPRDPLAAPELEGPATRSFEGTCRLEELLPGTRRER